MTDKELGKYLITEEEVGIWMEENGKKGFIVDYTREARLAKAIPIIAEEIKRELEKFVVHEEVTLLDVVCGKEWHNFWKRRGIG